MQEATYRDVGLPFVIGSAAIVEIVSHPCHCRGKLVRTTPLSFLDPETGEFHTDNTRYTPSKTDTAVSVNP